MREEKGENIIIFLILIDRNFCMLNFNVIGIFVVFLEIGGATGWY